MATTSVTATAPMAPLIKQITAMMAAVTQIIAASNSPTDAELDCAIRPLFPLVQDNFTRRFYKIVR